MYIGRSKPETLPKEYAAIVYYELVKILYEKIYGIKIKDNDNYKEIIEKMGIEK